MADVKYDNGVLICANHGTTISKRDGKFYCAQCQHNAKAKKKKPPSIKTIERWFMDGYCKTPDGCKVEPDGSCPHGQQSWMLILGLI